MGSNLTRANIMLSALTLASCPAVSQVSAAEIVPQASESAAVVKQTPRQVRPFVRADFNVPVSVQGEGFQLVPLGPERVKADFDAYMSSIDHLQKTFSRSTSWPRPGITADEAMQDMQTEQTRFKSRASFAYAVMTPDGLRERGSVYVSPSAVEGFDATVRMWVTKADYDAGFDAELYRWVTGWIKKDWPFAKVAYPGRSIDWTTWDSLVAAHKAKQNAAK